MPNPGFGVEEFINLLMVVLRFYIRHEVEINKYLNATHRESMALLVRDMDQIQNINPPGPNSVPNTEDL